MDDTATPVPPLNLHLDRQGGGAATATAGEETALMSNNTLTARTRAFDYAALNNPEMEQTARQAAEDIRKTHVQTILGILENGTRLTKIKRLMPGQFLAWVESECWFTRSTAANYMKAARWAQQRFAKLPMIGNLEPSALYRIAHYSTSKKSLPQAIARLEAALQNGPLDLAEVDLIIAAEEQQEAARAERF